MKILSKKITNKIVYGRLEIETRLGVLEYSYQTGTDTEPDYQLEDGHDILQGLTDEEQDQLAELITNEIY